MKPRNVRDQSLDLANSIRLKDGKWLGGFDPTQDNRRVSPATHDAELQLKAVSNYLHESGDEHGSTQFQAGNCLRLHRSHFGLGQNQVHATGSAVVDSAEINAAAVRGLAGVTEAMELEPARWRLVGRTSDAAIDLEVMESSQFFAVPNPLIMNS